MGANPFSTSKGVPGLDIDERAKEIVQEIGSAINESVENSSRVADAIDRLRDAGYEMELTLRLEIALRPNSGDEESSEEDSARSEEGDSPGQEAHHRRQEVDEEDRRQSEEARYEVKEACRSGDKARGKVGEARQ